MRSRNTPTKVVGERREVAEGMRSGQGSGAGEGGVEAIENDVEVVGDFRCEAIDASDGGEAHKGRDEGILEHVLTGVFVRKAARQRECGRNRRCCGT